MKGDVITMEELELQALPAVRAEVEELKARARYALWWLEAGTGGMLDARVIHAKRALLGEELEGSKSPRCPPDKGGPLRFEHNGADFRIRFQYTKSETWRDANAQTTVCHIEHWRQLDVRNHQAVFGWGTVATASAACSRDDVFVKEEGRMISLRRAANRPVVNKELRRRIWGAYQTRGHATEPASLP